MALQTQFDTDYGLFDSAIGTSIPHMFTVKFSSYDNIPQH